MSPSPLRDTEARVASVVVLLGLERPDIERLAGGAANRSFRLRDATHDLVLRLAGPSAARLGANIRSEIAMQTLAAGAGLAPGVVRADASAGFVVSHHVVGRRLSAGAIAQPRMARRIGEFLTRLHALAPPPGLPVVDFGARAAAYLARLGARRADDDARRLERELARRRAALDPPIRLAPCHHDLHHRNLIESATGLVAVDWEYAGPGDPAADLACCIGYHSLDAAAADALIEGYGAATPAWRARVAALAWIFDCLWFGWNALAALDGLAVDPAGQARLAARLAH